MTSTIYAFGCSVTHGCEIATVTASEENVLGSYPVKIAQQLNLQCENWAIPGNSNEYIFHNFMDVVTKANNIAFVIVGWTSPVREVWKAEGRLWQYIPGWCATQEDITKPYGYVYDPKPRWSPITPRCVADSESYLEPLHTGYEFFTRYKWDIEEYTKKRWNYISAVRAYCQQNNIKLIETSWYDRIPGINVHLTDFIDTWLERGVHPSRQDHIIIADYIIKHYNL